MWLARPGSAVELQVVGEEVLTFDGTTLALLAGDPAAAARAAGERRPVRDRAAVQDLVARGILAIEEPSGDERLRRPDHVGFCEDGDVLVLMDLRNGFQHVLSETAADVWWLVVDTGTLEGALSSLEQSFPQATSLRTEAAAFVRDLVSQELLEPVI
jgi:hypothetical protein